MKVFLADACITCFAIAGRNAVEVESTKSEFQFTDFQFKFK